MKRSNYYLKTVTTAPKDEQSVNAKLLVQAGFVNKLSAGVYSLLPLGFRVLRKIEDIIRDEMEKAGGQELFLPSMHPAKNWEKTGRLATYEDIYKLKEGEKEFVLGPTHEEVAVPLAKSFIHSYRDLPLALFQFQNKFRKELRAKSGLMRGREFMMKDLYSFHADETDLDTFYDKMTEAYQNIFKRVGLSEKTFFTFASGGSFSKYSHEFQTLTEAGEDLIYICDKCKIAVNKEIISELKNTCPQCGNQKLREEKAVEVGNIFKLKTKFSAPFDLSFSDAKGEKKTIIMGCYGIGLQRLIGTIAEVWSDEKGLVWPKNVSPFDVYLISLGAEKDHKVKKTADKLYEELKNAGVEVLYDEREASPGEKFSDADLIGIPLRVVVSPKTLANSSVEIKKRTEKEASLSPTEKALKTIIAEIK